MDIKELEAWFAENKQRIPAEMQLNSFAYCSDTAKFIDVTICTLKANSGNRTFLPYYFQLVELKKRLESNHFLNN